MMKFPNSFKNEKVSKRRGILYIGKSYIESLSKSTKLCAEIKIKKDNNIETDILYFEVEKSWSKYLVTEYSDPFLLAVIKKAMKHGYDIECEGYISDDLYYNLVTYVIPIYARNINIFQEIKIKANTIKNNIISENAVGTGFSAGVDSFYTVLKHLSKDIPPEKKITHLVLALNGAASTGINKELDDIWFNNSMKKLEPYAKNLNLKLIGIKGNIDLFYQKDSCFNGEIIVTASFIHALRKLFSIYYWASAYPAEIFGFPNLGDAGFWENISVSYVSVEGLRFYHSGSETNRIGKVKYIADNEIAQNGLTVCGHSDAQNCGRCVKCLRTMAELNALRKLNLFKNAFPVDKYKENINSRLAEEFILDHEPFLSDIKYTMKKNRVKISNMVYFKAWFIYKPLYFFRKKLKHINSLRKIYYYFNLDEKIGGRKDSSEERKAKFDGLGKS